MSEPDGTSTGERTDAENPWPGLRSYDESEQDFFYGRPREAAELLRLVKRDVLTVFFGISGIGKSSVLKAGLFPLLRREGYLPVHIRLDFADPELDLAGGLRRSVEKDVADRKLKVEMLGAPFASVGEETLWECFHRLRVWDHADLLTPVLVLDQFEELFTLGAAPGAVAAVRAFVGELADLVENQIPEPVRRQIEATRQHPTFSYDQQPCRIILSLREDYLANLESLVPEMPALSKRNRFRLLPMNSAQALEAVVKPGRALVTREVAQKIVNSIAVTRRTYTADAVPADAAAASSGEIEPFLLSLVCRELNNRRRERKLAQISAELVDEAQSGILSAFYERCFAGVPPAVRVFVEDELVGPTGYREMVAVERALGKPGVTREAIDNLVSQRLLRIEEDRHGVQRVELTHDRLTLVAAKSRDQRKAVEEKEAEWRRKAVSRRRLAGAVFGVLAVFTVGAAAFAYVQVREARANASLQVQQARADAEKAALAQKLAELTAQYTTEVARKGEKVDPSALRRSAETEIAALNRVAEEPLPSVGREVPPRVYLQIQQENQRAGAKSVIPYLQKARLTVPGIELLAAGPSKKTEVRYFRREDERGAMEIVGVLTAANIPNVVAKYVAGYEESNRIRPRHYEVWFAPSAFAAASH